MTSHLTVVLLASTQIFHSWIPPPASVTDIPRPPRWQLEAPGALRPLPFPEGELAQGAPVRHQRRKIE